jgi:hypothetical protein
LISVGIFAVIVPASAQTVQMTQTQQSVLRAGTPISLRILEGVTTKDKVAKINDRVRMEVAEPVRVNDVVVIPSGSPAVGELTDVRYKGMWGKSGRLVGRALNINANGRTIRVSGTFDDKGGSGTGAAVAVSAIVFAPAGFFMTGKSAELPAGTVVRAFIDEDIPLTIVPSATTPASTAQQPMVVGK